MAVTKQIYSAAAGWTQAQFANLFRSAFIDAGLMTDWHDASVVSTNTVRVLRVQHNAARTYGSSFYYFIFRENEAPSVSIASGWDTQADVPAGTQFLDYHTLPANINNIALNYYSSSITSFAPSVSSTVFLDRFTSGDDTKQSWFVVRQGTGRSLPFTVLHKDTSLHPWLDLDKGIINGYATVGVTVNARQGYINFCLQENIRRCLLTGPILRGTNSGVGQATFHTINFRTHAYVGFGSESNLALNNYQSSNIGGAVPLPVGKASANPAFLTDYVPVCTNLPWSPFTPTRLADDFGIYMHYSDNTIVYGDRFVTQAGVNEWETLQFVNNAVVVDGASATFLARVV